MLAHRSTWGYCGFPQDAVLIGGTMYAWLEDDGRVVFYDWDNDEGLCLSRDEWERALVWWTRCLDETPAMREHSGTPASPRRSEGTR